MVLPSTEEQLALGGRRQRISPSVYRAARVGIAVSLGLQRVTTFQPIWGKTLQGKSCIIGNTRESEVASNDKALLSSFPLSGDALRFSVSVLPAGVQGRGAVREYP